MSSFVVSDALLAGLKEAGKVGVLYLILRCVGAGQGRGSLVRFFFYGVLFSLAAGIAAPFLADPLRARAVVGNVIFSSFAVFLLLSGLALLQSSGIPLFGPLMRIGWGGPVSTAVSVTALSVLFLLPEAVATGFGLHETAIMREMPFGVPLSALGGALAAGTAVYFLGRMSFTRKLGDVFDIPQVLLLCAVLKLFGSGMRGVEQITLIPSIQTGLIKFFHDVVHQNFVFFMVPDHPLLRATAWDFIGILFSPNFSLFVSLLIVLAVPLMFLSYQLFRLPGARGTEHGAERRKTVHAVVSSRRKKAAPVVLFICLIWISWYVRGGETSPRLHNPSPKPLVAEAGTVRIPLADPTMNLNDGKIRKFALMHDGRELRLFIVSKPDATLSVCLDACEICPPEGYGQREQFVICIFCNTPIPVETLGRPGGCNPIPLDAQVEGDFLTIAVDELVRKTGLVNTGKGKEPGR